MYRLFIAGLLLLAANINASLAQTVDLTSVDEFIKVASTIKAGKEVSAEQWKAFENSAAYKKMAARKNKKLISIIKSSMNMAFGKNTTAEKERVLSITKEQMATSTNLLLKKLILANYLDVNNHFDSIKSFRENYDFNGLINRVKQRLSSFLGTPLDSTAMFNPVRFFFINADGSNEEDALYIDFNLVYKLTEQQRINFLAHEFFHNYREHFENHDFNYKSDLNYTLDLITNEGIADLIDKSEGYEKYYSYVIELPEMVETMTGLYHRAPENLEKLQQVIMQYANGEISETKLVDNIIEFVKFNGHAIGFYMANQIVAAGYKSEMLQSFYNPYQFYRLYNKAAKKLNGLRLSDEFMGYLRRVTEGYYRN